MSHLSPDVEAGIRAFMRGDRAEAERLWRVALSADPQNERAREYLAALAGARDARGGPAAVPSPARPAGSPASAPTPAPARPVAAPTPVPRRASASAWDEEPARAAIDLPSQGGVDLATVEAVAQVDPLPSQLQDARDLFALGDFSGSLEIVEGVLRVDPVNPEALAYLRENEATLVAMYESRLGPLDAIPRVQVRPEEVLWLNLDHRAGFLLAQIDGTLTWEDLFALSALARLDTARILARLVTDGVVAAR